jgi:hypothetical protein
VRVTIPGTQVQAPGWYVDPVGQARFRYWDGGSWTAQTSNAKDPTGSTPPLGPGFARLGDWLGRLLALQALLLVAGAVAVAWGYTEVSSYGATFQTLFDTNAARDPALDDALSNVALVMMLVLAAWFLVYAVTGVLWLVWQARLAASAPAALRRSSGLQVLAWFIPVVNWWWPCQDMRDLWVAYGEHKPRGTDTQASPVGLWWGLYLGGPFLFGFLSVALTFGASPESLLARVAAMYVVYFLGWAGVALLARGVVTRLSWRALEFWATTE